MLSCLGARIETFPKGSHLLRAGDAVEAVGLVLAGSALIVQEDTWGNRNILSKAMPGQTFAEVFACAPGAVLNVSVEAESAVTVMFLHIRRVLSVCPSACSHHSRIIRNLLNELAVELGKMRDEGLLDFHKSHFLLKTPETDRPFPSAR